MGCLAPGLGGLPPGAGGAGGGHGLDDGVAQRQGGAHAGPGEQREDGHFYSSKTCEI